ncbi:helix-turn-helix domain-containing protein [Micromonospora humida]|uniref:helix-turn-helix domain-containing protein n=1 Tax=Micromonospora humida TaxID=2809018 RepID=UPI00366D0E47
MYTDAFGILGGMTKPPRVDAPEAVESLLSTIEAYCEHRTGKPRPVREIAAKTGLKRSTVSGWFNYRSFPKYEMFLQFLTYFEVKAWRDDLSMMWQAAWKGHQDARLAAERSSTDTHAVRGPNSADGLHTADGDVADRIDATDGPGASPTSGPARTRWGRLLVAVGCLLVALIAVAAFGYAVGSGTGSDRADQRAGSDPSPVRAGPGGTGQPADSTGPAAGVVGGTCMAVSARDVRVFTSARADEVWTTWRRGMKFWVDRDASSQYRYRTVLRSGRHAWVTSDSRYIEPATGCP